jgi:hypothetical protein
MLQKYTSGFIFSNSYIFRFMGITKKNYYFHLNKQQLLLKGRH